MAPVDVPHRLELAARRRGAVRDRDHGEVGQHEPGRLVELLRTPLPPCRDALRHAALAPPQLARMLQPPPRLLGHDGRARATEQDGELLLRPLEAPRRLQPLREQLPQLEEVGHVARRVAALRVGERAARPVGQLVALLEADPEQTLDEREQRRRAEADEARGELGVEDGAGRQAARPLQHLQVLVGSVEHGDAVAGEHAGERGDVDGQRVDQRDRVVPGDLEQGEMRVVAPLAVELGVDPVLGRVDELVDEALQLGTGRDELVLDLLCLRAAPGAARPLPARRHLSRRSSCGCPPCAAPRPPRRPRRSRRRRSRRRTGCGSRTGARARGGSRGRRRPVRGSARP